MMREENKMIFASRCREARLVMKPTDVILDDLRHPQVLKGKTLVFKNGRYMTTDPEEIKFLMEHPDRPAEFDMVPENVFVQRKDDIQLIRGAVGTAGDTVATPKEPIESIPGATIEIATAVITEKVMQAMDEKFAVAMGQILEVLKATPQIPPPYKTKKVFTCPVCKEVFLTGMKVGEHKRIAHPELFEKKTE